MTSVLLSRREKLIIVRSEMSTLRPIVPDLRAIRSVRLLVILLILASDMSAAVLVLN